MANIKIRNGKHGISYYIRVSTGYDASGKQIMQSYTYKPQAGLSQRLIDRELQQHIARLESQNSRGLLVQGNITFAEFSETWLNEDAKPRLSPKCFNSYTDLLKRINASIGHVKLSQIRPDLLLRFYNKLRGENVRVGGSFAISTELKDYLKDLGLSQVALMSGTGLSKNTIAEAVAGRNVSLKTATVISKSLSIPVNKLFQINKSSKTLSDKTIRHYHALISSILSTAVEWQVIEDNVAKRIKAPRVPRKEAKFLDDKQVQTVIDLLFKGHIKWRTILLLLLSSGMRRGELCGLEWKDIDFENQCIFIRRSSQYLPRKGVFDKETKNFSSVRPLSLSAEIFYLLRQFQEWQLEEKCKMGDLWIESGKVFTQINGLPIHPDTITTWVQKFVKKNNLPPFSPHSLRHTNITLMIAAGVPIRQVSQRAGHSQVSTTGNIYAHAIKSADEKAAEKIGDILNISARIKNEDNNT